MSSIPSVKVENVGEPYIKPETNDTPSPMAMSDGGYMDDIEVDDPELDMKSARTELWMTKIPNYLWEVLAKANDDDEIEIGTVRVEGNLQNPERVSVMLNKNIPSFQVLEKEWTLNTVQPSARRSHKPGQALLFSEKDKPGYKAKTFQWDDIDEDGNPGQGRSFLYEQQRREEKKKENKGKFTPYVRRPIPKLTSVAGTIAQEFDAVAVQNDEYRRLDARRKEEIFKPLKANGKISFVETIQQSFTANLTHAEKQNTSRASQLKKQAARDNRAARWDKGVIVDRIFDLFREHRFWGLRDMRARLKQPESWIKENLEEVAVMHRAGDFNGKWELKDEYKNRDETLMNSVGEAPKLEGEDDGDSDVSMKSEDEDDDGFEDVGV